MVGTYLPVVVIVLMLSSSGPTLQCECDKKNHTAVNITVKAVSEPQHGKQPESRGRSFGFLPKINMSGDRDDADQNQNDDEDGERSHKKTSFSGFGFGDYGADNGPPFGGIFSNLVPAPLKSLLTTSTTTTTTTTTPAPIQEFNQNAYEIGMGLSSAFNAPIKVINGLTQVSSSGVNRAAEHLVKSTSSMVQKVDSQQEKMTNVMSGVGTMAADQVDRAGPKDDSMYYEYGPPMEPFAERRPKYFSRECQFRFACEVGRVMKPFTRPVAGVAANNKFLLDLQNRYTRAITYGNLYDSCERYYCVLVQLMGGPVGFAGGVTEIVNRLVNKDQYEDVTLVRK